MDIAQSSDVQLVLYKCTNVYNGTRGLTTRPHDPSRNRCGVADYNSEHFYLGHLDH